MSAHSHLTVRELQHTQVVPTRRRDGPRTPQARADHRRSRCVHAQFAAHKPSVHCLKHDCAHANAGQIGYAIVAMAASGQMLGPQQPLILHMLDIEPAKTALEGVKMELLDAAYPLLVGARLVASQRELFAPAGCALP